MARLKTSGNGIAKRDWNKGTTVSARVPTKLTALEREQTRLALQYQQISRADIWSIDPDWERNAIAAAMHEAALRRKTEGVA